ncbi:unnamed protein product, partial [Rotaria magnacalcarata]
FLFCNRSTPHSTTNLSPAELFLKRRLRTVLDLLHPNAMDASSSTRQRYKLNFDRHSKQRHFKIDDKVLVRGFRKNPGKVEWTSGVLISRIGSRLWSVKVGEQIWRRHENQIRQRYWSTDGDLIVTHQTTESVDCDDGSSSCSPPDQQSKVLRRSARTRKPIHRLIEQI